MNALRQNLKKYKNKNGSWAIVSKCDFQKDTTIYEFSGTILTKDKLPTIIKPEKDCYLQIGANAFIGPSGDYDDLVNHSCSPNAGIYIVGNRALLKSIMLIPAGVEITFDWSTTSTDTTAEWAMPCKCGAFSCRKLISGFNYLDPGVRERYIRLGVVPSYLTEKKN